MMAYMTYSARVADTGHDGLCVHLRRRARKGPEELAREGEWEDGLEVGLLGLRRGYCTVRDRWVVGLVAFFELRDA